MKTLLNLYCAIWCVVMPVTSFLLIPEVQGTTPAYLLGFGSIGVVLFLAQQQPDERKHAKAFFLTLAAILGGAISLTMLGQLGLTLSDHVNIDQLHLIDPENPQVLFRPTIVTQMLYFIPCILTFAFFRYFFRTEWMPLVFAGAWFLAIYGLYDWLYFAVTKESGDFLSNRTFGETEHTASWTQGIFIGGKHLMRLKSFTGEPSMFSIEAVPYFLLAFLHKKRILAGVMFGCILLSTSTSAYIGVLFAIVYIVGVSRSSKPQVLLLMAAVGMAAIVLVFAFPDTFETLFIAKLSGQNNSGSIRMMALTSFWDFFSSANFLNQLFGIGFGYTYSTVNMAVLLNTGCVGFAIFTIGFLYPVLKLSAGEGAMAIKAAMVAIYFLYSLSVTELFYPTTWMFLGVAYWTYDQQCNERRERRLARRAGIYATT